MGGVIAAQAWWEQWGEVVVKLGAVTTGGSIVWAHVIAPLVFRPIGKALARGARHEAQGVITEVVQPQLDDLRRGQAGLSHQVADISEQVGAILDRTAPHQ